MLFWIEMRESSLESKFTKKKPNSFRYFTCGRLQHKTNTHVTTICNESWAILHICICWFVRWDGPAANVLRMRMNGHTQRHTNYRLRLGDSIFCIGLYDRLMFRVGTSLFCDIFFFLTLRHPIAIWCVIKIYHNITLNFAKHMRKSTDARINHKCYYCSDFSENWLIVVRSVIKFYGGLACTIHNSLVVFVLSVRFELRYLFIIYCFIGFVFKISKHSFVSPSVIRAAAVDYQWERKHARMCRWFE